eukprot:Skav202191  [mRNA]  locus=scaffold191:1710:2990:- [translate_table: standard]
MLGNGIQQPPTTQRELAPNQFAQADFRRINLEGTRHVLKTAAEMGVPVVFSSTTSLMNTKDVKDRTRRSASGCRSSVMVLKATEDYGTPRNIYGVTKKLAEEYCKESSCSVAILRCSRFFAEDIHRLHAEVSALSNGNVKANELLCGTRASLEDMVMAHLLALVKLTLEPQTLGPLIVSSPSPLLETDLLRAGDEGKDTSTKDVFSNGAKRMYEALGWTFPALGRILDSRPTWQSLKWQPSWSFDRLVEDFEGGASLELIRDGAY